MTAGCRACGGLRPPRGTSALCARCAGVLHDLTVGKPAPYLSFPPKPEPTPGLTPGPVCAGAAVDFAGMTPVAPSHPSPTVFPNQMEARCAEGHTWTVEMVWGAVPGMDTDVRVRFPERWFPPQCPACAGEARGFQRLPESA